MVVCAMRLPAAICKGYANQGEMPGQRASGGNRGKFYAVRRVNGAGFWCMGGVVCIVAVRGWVIAFARGT